MSLSKGQYLVSFIALRPSGLEVGEREERTCMCGLTNLLLRLQKKGRKETDHTFTPQQTSKCMQAIHVHPTPVYMWWNTSNNC